MGRNNDALKTSRLGLKILMFCIALVKPGIGIDAGFHPWTNGEFAERHAIAPEYQDNYKVFLSLQGALLPFL